MDPVGSISRQLAYGMGPRVTSAIRRFRVALTHRHCTVAFEGPVRIGPGFLLKIPGQGTLEVGPDVEFRRGTSIEISDGGRVTIGARTVLTYDTVIQCSTSIDIGEDCMIGRALIADGNHRFRDPHLPVMAQGYDFRSVTIGDGACVTTNAVVVASIGERVFVGANAVVSRPITDYSLAVGAPAKAVEYYGPADADPGILSVPRHMRSSAA